MESTTRIGVAIRIRPLLKEEKDQGISSEKLNLNISDNSIM